MILVLNNGPLLRDLGAAPHVTFEQAKAMTRSLLKGDPDRGAIVRQTLRDLVEDVVPHA